MVKRIAVIENDKCNPQGCGNYLCIRACPVNRSDVECIVKGDETNNFKAKIYEETCTGCGICPKICPYGAIHIINLPEELDKDPIHRYSKNGFQLFSLPTPIFGKVVGVLGVNGIGKSTAIKILSGTLKPNFGDYEGNSFSYGKLIEYFKGTEAQTFFENVRDGKVSISYKPQAVDLIPKYGSGKVIDLLNKIETAKDFDAICKKLGISDILEMDIKKISGGELQRVAIAACMLKKANLYIFDELTSYLDIKQRMNVSRMIKEMADEHTAVIVVEHDLISLDYMTDLVHIMFGEKGAYGIVSMPKSVKNGINAYLEGYLKEENVKFRNNVIKFDVRSEDKNKPAGKFFSWQPFTKKLDSFSLDVSAGEMHQNEIIGIIGENGIGKTTFAKILAGVIKPDSGSIESSIKISYKPQYIDGESEELVMNVLREAVKKHHDLMIALQLNHLLTKQINELSGGELQRVAIAECLSRECDVFLLDEPSAFLDVEQRLAVSKAIANMVIKNDVSCFVIDHDLLFLDYLSHKLLVFAGEPSKHGKCDGPFEMGEGMNMMLRMMNISFRRDSMSRRPRMNKQDSQKDREQKASGRLYYS